MQLWPESGISTTTSWFSSRSCSRAYSSAGEHGHAGRAADEQFFLVGKASCHFEGFRVGDLHDLVGKAPIKGLRIEVLADAFDLASVHIVRVGVDGALRIGADDLHRAVGHVLQTVSGAGDGAAGPMPATKCVTLWSVASQISGPVLR